MKFAFTALNVIVLFASCQKDLSPKEEFVNGEIVSSDALTPLPCHTTAFISNYPVKAGEVPPFRFSKTLYVDSRVKTINMLSRVYPIHSQYKKHAVELIGTFSYGPGVAYLKGTSQVWEYYKTSTGAGAKRSISKKNVSYKFYFTAAGYSKKVTAVASAEREVLAVYFDSDPQLVSGIYLPEDPIKLEGAAYYYPIYDKYNNLLSYDLPYNRWASRLSYTYDYTIPRNGKNYSFIPSQNLISQEYSLLEVMQWLPQSNHQRKSVSGIFFPYKKSTYPFNTGQKVVQTQYYFNYKFDSRKNQISLTYADNVLQKTTWFCE